MRTIPRTKDDNDEVRMRALQLATRYRAQLGDPFTRARLDALELSDLAGAVLASIMLVRAALRGWVPADDSTLPSPTTNPVAELDPPRHGEDGRGHGRPLRSQQGAAAIYPTNAAPAVRSIRKRLTTTTP